MSPKKTSSRGKPLVAQFSGSFRSAGKDIESFRENHAGWLEKWENAGPVYRLPPQCVVSLTKPLAAKRPILDKTAVEAEMAFTDVCCDRSGIGYWIGHLIPPGFLARPASLPSRFA